MRVPRSPRPCGTRGSDDGHARLAMPSASGETAKTAFHLSSKQTRRISRLHCRLYHAAAAMHPMSLASLVFTLPGLGSFRKTMRCRPLFSREIAIQDARVDGFQSSNILHGNALVHLVNGIADQAEFEHGAMVLDESRIRRSACSGKRRRQSGFRLYRADDQSR